MRAGSVSSSPRAGGFTLLVMMGVLVALGLGLSLAGPAWRDQIRREREAEWLRVGDLYAQALESYAQSSPGSLKAGPKSVDELLLDTRFISLRRHLRQAYSDPLQPMQPWQVRRDEQGRIVGFFSDAPGAPFLARVPDGSRVQWRGQGGAYSDWVFAAGPPAANSSKSSP